MSQLTTIIHWYEVYHKLALALQKFYTRHQHWSGHELFKSLNKSRVYKANNLWFSNMERASSLSIEPIQLFVSFNRSGQKEEVRKEIINVLWALLSPEAKPWNDINFEGCPAPLAIKLQYIRPEPVQAQIWEVFNSVMTKGKNALNPNLWNNVKLWSGIQIPSFTIFLFWINSEKFIPLDKNTRMYLEQAGFLQTKDHLGFETYERLLNDKRIADYNRISLEAYYFNSDPNIFKERFQDNSLLQGHDTINTSFKLIGLRTLKRNKSIHKILPKYQYYPFDSSILPSDALQSELHDFHQVSSVEISLYDLENLHVNITAIVGKNGSGKSTLMDLILMGIYNLSIKLGFLIEEVNKPLKNLNFEIYWQADTLYKIIFGEDITAYRYSRISEADRIRYKMDDAPFSINGLNGRFFYTILVNYSHYALNSSEEKLDWITPLSHKNDGYATPLVINPQRTDGTININNEKTLLNMRLLLNLLELHDSDIPEQSFRYLDNGKYLKYFSLSHDKRKSISIKKEVTKLIYEDIGIIQLVLDEVCNVFSFTLTDVPYKQELEFYIVKKLHNIVERYDRYKSEYKEGLDLLFRNFVTSIDGETDFQIKSALEKRIRELVEKIKEDKSHISIKFKQAVYYLKYHSLQIILSNALKSRNLIDLDVYNQIIGKIINSNQSENLTESELLPPAIFKLDFHLDDKDKSSFSKASSGEYQLVSVLSSILYHIRNINSISEGNRYNYISVLLDEIELYFHPNMQRFFIKKLLEALSKLDNDLYGIHILFATHSPFILSDIEQKNILKLKNGNIAPNEDHYNTFAANIHDLLADEFFLSDGHMGAFAKEKIETAINRLNYITAKNKIEELPQITGLSIKERQSQQQKLQDEITKYSSKSNQIDNLDIKFAKQDIHRLIEITGEPMIKERLRTMYRSAFPNDAIYEEQNRKKAKDDILQMMQEYKFKPEDLQ